MTDKLTTIEAIEKAAEEYNSQVDYIGRLSEAKQDFLAGATRVLKDMQEEIDKWKNYKKNKIDNERYRQILKKKDYIIELYKQKNKENLTHFFEMKARVKELEEQLNNL